LITRSTPLLACLCACAVALAICPLGAQNPEIDLLIRNGHVIDPRNNIDGVMDVAIAGDRIAQVASSIQPSPKTRVVDAKGLYVVPGLIDTHLHFPQMQVMASYAANLLEWLNTYTFPEECRFVETAHAERIAVHFFD
jgi:cytosine/adenosine deaminase-related metal-dependent hydrolase